MHNIPVGPERQWWCISLASAIPDENLFLCRLLSAMPVRKIVPVGQPTGKIFYPCRFSWRATDRKTFPCRFPPFSCQFVAHRDISESGSDAVSFLRTCLAQPRGGLIPTTFSRRPCPVLYTMWRWFKWAYIIAIFQSKNMSVQTMASTDNAIFGYPWLLLCSSFACSSLLKFHLETSQCSPYKSKQDTNGHKDAIHKR